MGMMGCVDSDTVSVRQYTAVLLCRPARSRDVSLLGLLLHVLLVLGSFRIFLGSQLRYYTSSDLSSSALSKLNVVSRSHVNSPTTILRHFDLLVRSGTCIACCSFHKFYRQEIY